MRRFIRAFRIAFWSALHAETSRRSGHGMTIAVHMDSTEAENTIRRLTTHIEELRSKAEHAARVLERVR